MADPRKQAERRKARVRGAIKAVSGRARLSVFRSSKHIYAQVIDDRKGETLVSASSVEKGQSESCSRSAQLPRGLPTWCLIAAAIASTAGLRPWPTPRAKAD